MSLSVPLTFESFPRIPRLSREIVITEKIDGSNAQVFITDDRQVWAGSRNRWLTVENDNFGFARWVAEHTEELKRLGPGRHFGEWWGAGIQRTYGLQEKRFSLFNVHRWCPLSPEAEGSGEAPPSCCSVVPVLFRGPFSEANIMTALSLLREQGSLAAPGFMKPEGIVIYHTAAKQLFKKTLEDDEKGKTA